MMMPLPKQMQMRPIRHRRRRAHPHHHHPPTHARLVSSVPSSHARRLSVDRPRTRARLSSSSFIHSFIPLERSGDVSDRPRWGCPHAGVLGVPCVSDRPPLDRARERSDDRSIDRSIARLGGRSDASCLIVTSHHSSLRPTHDAATPRRHDSTRRIVRGPGGDGSDRDPIGSDRRARVTRAWTGTSTRLARRDG